MNQKYEFGISLIKCLPFWNVDHALLSYELGILLGGVREIIGKVGVLFLAH